MDYITTHEAAEKWGDYPSQGIEVLPRWQDRRCKADGQGLVCLWRCGETGRSKKS